ncbi:MAG: acyl-CoA dehydrogenase family protein [Promethearchaeota archaeon]
MDFRFSAEEEAFRKEVQEFLTREWTRPEWDPEDPEAWEAGREFERKLVQRGWLTLAWPKQYGGLEVGHMTQLIFRDEMAYAGAPILDGQGINMVGPCIMVHGTDEQKQRFLPPIAKGEVVWSQGFSEPNAGSDLASLQCRAVRDGDDYVVNGQKTWTSAAARSEWIHVLVRTDPNAPKHRGISYLLVDMRSPGITTMPIVNMAGRAGFYETYFEDVRVPAANLLGEENRGWYAAMTTLSFERSSIGFASGAKRTLEELTSYCRETKRAGKPLIDDPRVRRKLANLAVEIEVGRLISYRVAWMQSQDQVPVYEASLAKTYTTELRQRIANTGMQILGLYGQLDESSERVPLGGRIKYQYLWTVGETIYAGSNEIQRNIMAQRGLGLPRE